MAYAIKYLFKFESSNGTTREIRVLQDGYTGEVIQRPLGRAPMLKKQQNGPVHGTSLEFYAECNMDREFIEFYTSNPKDYRVDLYAGSTLLWQGYITPELYSEPDIAPPYDVQVVATDGVGELKLYDYATQGTVTLRTLLSGLLSRTGLGTDIYLISSLKPGSAGAGALLEKTINLDYMAGRTCYEVLTYILDTLHATITWWKGAWILSRETNVTFTSGKVRYFNTAGNSALLADSVQTLGRLRANPAWPVGQLSTVIDPAKNRVTVQAPWHVVTCLRNSEMGSDADWTKAKNARYETDGYVLPININTGTSETAVISQATSMAGLRVPMNLSVKATGATSEISAQVTGAVLGVLLTYKVGNVTYHLVKGDDGVPVWQQGSDIGTYIPLRTRIDFQQQLATWDSSRIEAEELSIDNIPPFLQGTTFPAGMLTVYILGYCAKIYGAYLDVVLPKGYQDILRIDNGARGEGSEVEIAIGRATTDNAYYAAFLQGLLLDSGNLITSFSDANFPGGMDYLAFIARDYALSVALPRAKVTGTVYLESGIAAPPLVFTKGALNYWLQTWSWNLYEDELEIEGLTLPSASLTVESETILESNGSTVSSAGGAGSSSAGSSMGGGVGTNYWEIDGTLNTLLKPKDAYAYVHSKDGLFFSGATLSGTIVPDLYVDTVNNQRVLRSPLPLITGGDQIVIDGTPGGGGGGGGATTLAGLDDTNITNPQAGQMLSWNGTKWVNTNAPTGSITSVFLAAGATNGTLHLVVNGTAQSDVAVTGLGSMAYKSSLAASDIPNLSWNKITSDKPTTLSGYGITDALRFQAFPDTYVAARFTDASLAGLAATKYIEFWQTDAGFFNFKVGKLDAIGAITSTSSITGTSFVKSGGTSGQFLKADGSVDSNTYLTGIDSTMVTTALGYTPANVAALSNYVQKAGDTMTGSLTIAIAGDRKLVLKATDADNFSLISFRKNDDTELGYLGVKGSSALYWGNDTIYHSGNLTLATLAGSSAKGSTSLPIYYTGSALAPITDLDLLSQSTGYVKANRVYLTSSIYFYTETVGGTVCVRLNAPFITAGDQIVISGTPGGGGGGGATNLWGLDDVSVPHGTTTPSDGQVLTWDTSLAKWTNKSITSGVSSVVGQTGAVTTAQIATALTGAGYKLTDTTYSQGTGISISGTTISLASGVCTAGTYKSVTVDTYGRVTSGTNPTSLSGYGIRDAMNFYAGGSGTQTYLAARFINEDYATLAFNKYIEFWQSNAGWFNFHIGSLVSDGSITSTGAIRGASIAVTNGAQNQFLKADGSLDSSTYLTGNQTITLSGDVSGSGTTSISVSIGSGKVTNSMLAGSIENSKLNTIGVAKGGTGLTTWTGAYRLVYSTAATTLTTLAPNSTTTRKFLRQVGANNAATAPAWDTVTKTDVGLSNVENTALSTWAGTTNITTLGTITSGTWNGSAIAWSKLSISAQNLYDTIGSTTYAAYHAAGYVKKDGDTMTGALTPASIQVGVPWSAQYYTYSSLNTPDTQVAGFSFYHGTGTNYASGYPYGYANIISFGETSNALQFAWVRGVVGYSNLSVRSYENSVWGDWKKIWNSGNAGAGYAWECTTLTASGRITGTGGATINGGILMEGSTSGMFVGGASVGLGSSYAGGLVYAYGNNPLYFYTNSASRMIILGNGNVGIGTNSPGAKLQVNGGNFRVCSRGTEYLDISTSDVNINYDANDTDGFCHHNFRSNGTIVLTVNGSSKCINVYGYVQSTGDQVISSDATLKENLTPVTYSVADIAKARAVEFDWKDGRGHSMGSIAQDWLGIAPSLVHGDEGNMSLAYGQLALVNTILLARQSESHEERIKELEARVAELEMENERLRMN